MFTCKVWEEQKMANLNLCFVLM